MVTVDNDLVQKLSEVRNVGGTLFVGAELWGSVWKATEGSRAGGTAMSRFWTHMVWMATGTLDMLRAEWSPV